MAKRLPRPTLLRGLIKRRIIGSDPATIALINSRLDDPATYRALNDYYSTNQGNRWVDRLKVWSDWLWKHREAIFRILGLVVLFAEDGTPTVKDANDKPEPRPKRKAKVNVESVHGAKEEVVVTLPENPLDPE